RKSVRVTEVMYNPDDAPGGTPDNDEFEFIELKNIGAEPVDVTDLRLEGAVDFDFAASAVASLAPGEFLLVVRNEVAFASRYDTSGMLIAGQYTSKLGNGGEEIRLLESFDQKIHDFDYKDGWFDVTDGEGFSLAIRDETADTEVWDAKDGWKPSRFGGGSPGADDAGMNPGDIIVSEILTHTDAPGGDWVEFQNTTDADISLAGWLLSDDPGVPAKYEIGAGAVVPANGFIVFTQFAQFGSGGAAAPFGFSELGESIYLAQADGGVLGGFRVGKDFEAADREVTFGRYVTSTGDANFVAMSAAIQGLPNAYPLVGPIVINEIMYHPTSGNDEFIELHNPTGSAVPLYDPANPANTWRFLEGVDYAFPSGVSLPAGGRLLVVSTDPAAFRAKYGIDPSVPIYGPYVGALDDGGESVRLYKPGDPEPGGFVPYILADRVRYNEKAPWPVKADGMGHSASRLVPLDYGNDPANWGASTLGGTPGTVNQTIDETPPTAPADLIATAVSPTRIDLAWTAASDPQSGVAAYRVYRDGIQIGSPAGTAFSDETVAVDTLYVYEISAVNADGYEGDPSASVSITLAGIAGAFAADDTTVRVRFTEALDPVSAGAIAHYAIGGVTILGAALEPDGVTVALTTSPLASGDTYTVTVAGVTALSGNPVAPGIQATFRAGRVNGLYGEYYDNQDLTALTVVRTDPTIDFSWAGISPAPGVAANSISVRWTGTVLPLYTETYTFWTLSDDGVLLWVDGQLLVDNWTNHGSTEDSHSIDLVAGQPADIRMEYYRAAAEPSSS
ncbi:lamin tail domain-containing protein, partial [bacterium]|nr:lamin tail domain-containing protein [bacterium]